MQVQYVALADNQLSTMPPGMASVQILNMSFNAIPSLDFSELPTSLLLLDSANNDRSGGSTQ